MMVDPHYWTPCPTCNKKFATGYSGLKDHLSDPRKFVCLDNMQVFDMGWSPADKQELMAILKRRKDARNELSTLQARMRPEELPEERDEGEEEVQTRMDRPALGSIPHGYSEEFEAGYDHGYDRGYDRGFKNGATAQKKEMERIASSAASELGRGHLNRGNLSGARSRPY